MASDRYKSSSLLAPLPPGVRRGLRQREPPQFCHFHAHRGEGSEIKGSRSSEGVPETSRSLTALRQLSPVTFISTTELPPPPLPSLTGRQAGGLRGFGSTANLYPHLHQQTHSHTHTVFQQREYFQIFSRYWTVEFCLCMRIMHRLNTGTMWRR